jgi:hypothetical protein
VVAQPVVVGRSRDADDAGAGASGQLHDQRAHAAGRPGHDHRLSPPGGDRADRRVGGAADDEERAGDLPRHLGRLGGQVGRLDHDELGLRLPLVGEADHLVADGEPGHPGAELGHHAGQVTALSGREGGRPQLREQPLPDLGLARVDAGGHHPDQDLVRPGSGRRHLVDLQDVDPAEPAVLHCLWHLRAP